MLDYIPSWIVGAKTLLEKLNRCIEKIEETRHIIKDGVVTAGDNISINEGVISATDTKYTAGDNISINEGVISATDTKYTAGDGIEISGGNVISVVGKENYLYRHYITISRINQNLRGEHNRITLLFLSNISTPLTRITQIPEFRETHGLPIYHSGDIMLAADIDKLFISSLNTQYLEINTSVYLYSEYEIESDEVYQW